MRKSLLREVLEHVIPIVLALAAVGVFIDHEARHRPASAQVLPYISAGNRFSQNANPGAGNQATTTIPGVPNRSHVVNCVTFSAGSIVAPALTTLNVNLIDGVSGGSKILYQWEITVSAATGQNVAPITTCGFNLPASVGNALTVEWSAGLTNLQQVVGVTGYDQ
jgi:hypothetical protein